MARALRERWEIPQKARESLAVRLLELLETSSDARVKVLAARVLLLADSLNLAAEKAEDERQELAELQALRAEVEALQSGGRDGLLSPPDIAR
jgi:hypothetical protein